MKTSDFLELLSNYFADIKKPIIKFGFGHVGVFDKRYERSIWEVSGCIKVAGRFLKINIFQTIRFNTAYLPLSEAFKFPILIAHNVKILQLGEA